MSIDVTQATISLAEIMRRPWRALTIQELDALDATEYIKQGENHLEVQDI